MAAWIPDMESRATGLRTFYNGPVWRAHRGAVNATIIASDNVLLLRPVDPAFGFAVGGSSRAPRGNVGNALGIVIATTYALSMPVDDWCAAYYTSHLEPRLIDAGVAVLACCVTDPTPNNVPTLPVREDANVVVLFTGVAEEPSDLRRDTERTERGLRLVAIPGLEVPIQRLWLAPTARSLLTGASPAQSATVQRASPM